MLQDAHVETNQRLRRRLGPLDEMRAIGVRSTASGAPIAARAGFLAPTRWFRSLSLLELPELHGQLERGSELFARLVTVLCRCGCARSESDARPVEIISCTNSSCAERSALEVDNAGDQGNQKDVGRSESKREVARVDKHRSHRSRSAPSSGVSSGVLTSVRLASSSTPTRQHQPDTTTARIPPPTRRGPFIVSRSQLSFGERVTSRGGCRYGCGRQGTHRVRAAGEGQPEADESG